MKYGLDKLFWTVCQNSQPRTTTRIAATPAFRTALAIDESRRLLHPRAISRDADSSPNNLRHPR